MNTDDDTKGKILYIDKTLEAEAAQAESERSDASDLNI